MTQDVVKNKAVTINSSLTDGNLFHDGINYIDCDFLSTQPVGVEFKDCNFTTSEFYTLYLYDNKFINCTFTKCDFTQPIWSSVKFINCWFIQCSIEDDYDMDDVQFYGCAFMGTVFANKPEQSHDDKILFDKSSFNKTIFNNYCLDGATFKSSVLRETEFSYSSMKNVSIDRTNLLGCKLSGLHISNSKWNSSNFRRCSWNKLTFHQGNKFDNVVLMDTTTEDCKGDADTLASLIVSPYSTISGVTESTGSLQRQSDKPVPVPLKKSKVPCRYISEGL